MEYTKALFDFISTSPSCFHVVANIREILLKNGFTELKENKLWQLEAGRNYFVEKNGSAIIGFSVPKKDFSGFLVTASHSDSPCFKIKENPEMKSAGVVRLNVEKYGGMLMNPWFDRPLGIAGRVIVSESSGENISVSQRLVDFGKNLVMIPSLAIHMNRTANEGHKIDVQNEMLPLISGNESFNLLDYLSVQTGIAKDSIAGHDLYLYNRDEPSVWGAEDEFISAPKLDDLECVFSTLQGFLNSENSDFAKVFCVYDNEEVGSGSRQGAGSTFLKDTLRRINCCFDRTEQEYMAAVASSFLVSADNAHGVHPNFKSSADPVNQPVVNGGVVLKYNAAQKYTTDGISGGIFKEICRKAQVPFQVFTNNSNVAGGSTLGNISTSQVPFCSVDIGLAQWAMHSPYESAGAKDVEFLVKAIKTFYSSKICGKL